MCCENNDYSLLTANTGIATIASSNTSLSGSNALPVLTAASNGTIIKSVRIKATGPVTTGMIRLFVGTNNGAVVSLYKEIPVPTTPVLDNTPTPTPLLQTFEQYLDGGLKLQNGDKLYATTQNSETFNIITEGLDWKYPSVIPSTCCNFRQETALTGLGTVSTANALLDGNGAIVPVFTAAPTNGSTIKSITVKALQSTNENGMVRLFISPNGITYTLLKEIMIPQTIQSGFDPSFKVIVDMNMSIKAGYIIGASTQLTQSFALTVEGINWSYPIS